MTKDWHVRFGGHTDPYLSLVAWAVTLSNYGMVLSDPNVGTFYLFAISSPWVYGIITVGQSICYIKFKVKKKIFLMNT